MKQEDINDLITMSLTEEEHKQVGEMYNIITTAIMAADPDHKVYSNLVVAVALLKASEVIAKVEELKTKDNKSGMN